MPLTRQTVASTLSSKLSLLKLPPELQKDLMTGARKTEHVRNPSKLSPEAQKAKANERAEASKRHAQSRQHATTASAGVGRLAGIAVIMYVPCGR
ncbi:hypothetical protein [Streptomyces sennicomposti]